MATIVTRSGKGSPLTHAEVDSNFTNLNTDKLELSGGTMTGNLSFGDNDKAIFGAGSDLQIYHDGSNSYIDDAGTGNLTIRANQINFNKYTGEAMARFRADGNTELFYDNAAKLATTSTGVDITGTLTSDGLTVGGNILRDVDNNSMFISGGNAAATGANIALYGSTSGNVNDILLRRNNVKFAAFDGATGDLLLYEDTGTTAKFFWDASAESLGIGTTSPSATLHVKGADNSIVTIQSEGAYDARLRILAPNDRISYIEFGDTDDVDTGEIRYDHTTNSMQFRTNNNTERMRIDSSGNVGIGGTTLTGWANKQVVLDGGSNASVAYVMVNDTTGRSSTDGSVMTLSGSDFYLINRESANMIFRTANTERMRIDSSGNVGIGVVPSSHATNWVGLELNNAGSGIVVNSANNTIVSNNSYYNGTNWVYGANGYATNYRSESGTHKWNYAASGTAGNTISWSEAMRIDSSGQVGIGTSSPAAPLEVSTSSADYRIQLTHASGQNKIKSLDGDQSTFRNLLYDAAQHMFETSGSEAMRIDSSGNLLVGTTNLALYQANNDSTADNGFVWYEQFGFGTFSRNDNNPLILNRTGTDGDILLLRKGGSNVGSIGTLASDIYIGTADTGLRFNDAVDAVYPVTTVDGTGRDNAVDLGTSAVRFDDLYLSGGVKNSSGNLQLEVPETTGSAVKVLFGDINNTTRRTVEFYKDNLRPALADDGDIDLGSSTQRWRDLYLFNSAQIKRTSGTPSIRLHADHEATPRTAIEFMRGTSDTFGGDAFTDWKIGHVGSNQAGFAILSKDTTNGENERLSINHSSGNVGLGTSSPSANLHLSGSGARKIDITDTGGANTRISTANSNSYVGSTTNHPLLFITNDTERMRIDASGNLLVGVSSSSANMAGVEIAGNGQLYASTSSSSGHFFNRQSTDGDIVSFRKDGTTVGTIVADAGDLLIGTGITGLRFNDAANEVIPRNTSGVQSAGLTNLGNSSSRFKDLYLSGGVYLGGTGSANKLDDYEEGTFIVQDNNIGEYTNSYGRYTKIGNMVHCFGYFTVPSTSNANIADIYLPFTFGYYAQSHTIGTVLSNEVGNYYLKTSGSTTMAIVDQDESQQTLADFSTKTVRFNVTFHIA